MRPGAVGSPWGSGGSRRVGTSRFPRASRSWVGVTAKTSRMVALNCLMLAKPAAKAISDSGRAVGSVRMRAGWPAVDAGRGHPDEEHAVEPGILAARRLVAPLVVKRRHPARSGRLVLLHPSTMPARPDHN